MGDFADDAEARAWEEHDWGGEFDDEDDDDEELSNE